MGDARPAEHVSPEAVLTKATIRAADLLGLSGTDLAQIIGVSNSTVDRYKRGSAAISPKSKSGELALLLVRLYRSLDPLVGPDAQLRKEWMHSTNKALGGVPAMLIRKPDGLTRALSYLDRMHAAT